LYDYANRLIAIGSQGATTTYAYDPFGNRGFADRHDNHQP
jgi:YD repeat-containing protein